MNVKDRLDKLFGRVTRAASAEAELRLVGEAFEKLRGEYVKAWENSDPRDTHGREKMWVATTILTQVERTLRNTVRDGQVAQKEIDAIKKAGEPKKSSLRRFT